MALGFRVVSSLRISPRGLRASRGAALRVSGWAALAAPGLETHDGSWSCGVRVQWSRRVGLRAGHARTENEAGVGSILVSMRLDLLA